MILDHQVTFFYSPQLFSRQLETDALVAAVRALEALAHERTVAKLKQESEDPMYPAQDNAYMPMPYDPASVYLLETMVSISCQVPQHIEDLWYEFNVIYGAFLTSL